MASTSGPSSGPTFSNAAREIGPGRFIARIGETAPVVEWLCPSHNDPKAFVPARPQGASWCGAQDLCGNVWELDAEGYIHGGSFRTPTEDQRDGQAGISRACSERAMSFDPMTGRAPRPSDDVGFRVCLSAVPS